ncbi:nodulation efficiency protein D [Mycoplasma sp. CAG:776]|nr:nodulation efficiency protein D [Mycoplasma sp. CAG:776]
MWVAWLIIIILLTFLEVATVNLVSVWFVMSAIVSLFTSFVIDSFYIQFAIFVCLGIVLMLLTRPYLVKKLTNKKESTNLDRVIGMEGIVTEEITKTKIGEVKVDGKRWSAISNELIKAGEEVIIERIDGVKLIVRKGEE